ncbi:MAG: hypothetical protein M3Q51_07550 [Pseudomonadota bacterium]|nr:hypothetical protein [Pseudomonadota bacterium]MDQ3160859.1 hypothetical protein [Pseudomonadota bacterium]
MAHRNQLILTATVLVFGACLGSNVQAQSKQKKVYCWNENGSKICSDALPAAASNAARTEISAKSGLATGQVGRALSDSERADAVANAAATRRDDENAANRSRRDLAMVESYMTEADLRRAYGKRISLLDETLKASQLGLTSLRLSLITLLRQAGDWELDKKPVPKRLAASILKQHGELLRQQQILANQEQDRSSLDAELTDAVARYRALKNTGAAPPATAGAPASSPAG